MTDLEPKEPDEHCNARKTDGSGYCGHVAGWGTDHLGMGRCKFHGGNTENQEKKILNDLEDAAGHAAVALRLRLKHARQQLEDGGEVDWKEIDRLARTALDRTGHGPTERREVDADVEHQGDPIMVIERGGDGDD